MPRRFSDYDRIAVITGADSGIGQATAIALARAGFDIGITYHTDRDCAGRTAEAVRAAGRTAALLAPPEASYVTGASWVVDGGMMLMGPIGAAHLESGGWRRP